jgi:hypothetical protein
MLEEGTFDDSRLREDGIVVGQSCAGVIPLIWDDCLDSKLTVGIGCCFRFLEFAVNATGVLVVN